MIEEWCRWTYIFMSFHRFRCTESFDLIPPNSQVLNSLRHSARKNFSQPFLVADMPEILDVEWKSLSILPKRWIVIGNCDDKLFWNYNWIQYKFNLNGFDNHESTLIFMSTLTLIWSINIGMCFRKVSNISSLSMEFGFHK